MKKTTQFFLLNLVLLFLLLLNCVDSLSRAPYESDFQFTDIKPETVLLMKTNIDTVTNEATVYFWYRDNKADYQIRLGFSDTTYDTTNVWKIKLDSLWDTTFDTIIVGLDTTIDTIFKLISVTIDTLLIKEIDTFANMKFNFEESLNKSPNFFISGVTNKYVFKNLLPETNYFAWIYCRRQDVVIEIKQVFRTGKGFL